MILKPADDYKSQHEQLDECTRDLVDSLVFNVLNMANIVVKLGIDVDHHYIVFTLPNGKNLQFIIDASQDAVIVLLFDGHSAQPKEFS
jgi:hypothetical protein